ncbi:hypothetical protein ACQP2X_27420 [Actinoplanes sp. CA-131856]
MKADQVLSIDVFTSDYTERYPDLGNAYTLVAAATAPFSGGQR